MISKSYSIPEFVEAIADKNYSDILTITIQEATEVERLLCKTRSYNSVLQTGERDYADSLKRLICYLKCTIKPWRSKDPNFPFFEMLSKNIENETH